jgi:hypothetical protein
MVWAAERPDRPPPTTIIWLFNEEDMVLKEEVIERKYNKEEGVCGREVSSRFLTAAQCLIALIP